MIYYISKTHDTAFNIALEEYCFKQLKDEDEIFLLWINEPSIIVGKYQNTIEEINTEYTREKGIHVIRRISGGGAVYHDLNNLNYTIISNRDKGQEGFNFKEFSKPIIETLAELGVEAEFTGRNDLEIDGQKFCGNAQAYIKDRVMHHGCLLFNVDFSALGNALKVSKDKIESKGVKSVRSRVTNILPHLKTPITVEKFGDKIMEYMKKQYPDMKEYVFSKEELDYIAKRAEIKRSWEWNYGESPEFNITRGKRFKNGKIQIFATVENSRIKNIKFYGDFFGKNEDLSEIENLLKNVKYTVEDVKKKLESIDIGEYFSKFTVDEIVEVIVE
ncbi:lipoyltransferase and lipoate-protein ligase [Leptotrichia wadei]|jgi:lipoyltransferase and lipoate-protein ligase|uniref:lipoate--protein ligase n=1 Tax=Leptotrichia wadei TaxID=157687 RepID=A0A134AJR5_9FUSO|nr:lipoate--protein ligase [Leptotrichia wadei]KXB67976.1 lipoyltransferase and lipoate-protein ligase [Leptotrichia wadei]